MASVFLSYDHEDAARAAAIASALEASNHSVWWDRQLHGGAEYNSEIENAVERSDAVIVLWSEKSVRSAWVRDEAAEGRDASKLVPVLIGSVKPPMGFRQYQAIDFSDWTGGKRIPRLAELLNAIEKVAASASRPPLEVADTPKILRTTAPVVVASAPLVSRRLAVGGVAAACLALAGGGLWWSRREPVDPEVDSLLDQARRAIGSQSVDQQTVRSVERAVSLRPRSAQGLGILALVKSLVATTAESGDISKMVADAEDTAHRALSIDPQEPNALLAMFELQGTSLDWFARDRMLRQIITIDPRNVGAISELILLLQATGFVEESWDWNERALALQPLSPDFVGRRALKLWIRGQVSAADKVSDQLRALYPADPWPLYVRFKIYAYTGRAKAALDILDDHPAMEQPPALGRFWRAALAALDQPSAGNVAKAREASTGGAAHSAQLANEAVQVMSKLGELDTAFEIANGALLSRGSMVPHGSDANAAQDAGWRISTQWMFTPPVVPMRRDPRFLPLCAGIGLTDYWRRRGVKPDYLRA